MWGREVESAAGRTGRRSLSWRVCSFILALLDLFQRLRSHWNEPQLSTARLKIVKHSVGKFEIVAKRWMPGWVGIAV